MPSTAPRAPCGYASAFFQIFISALVAMTALLLLWWNETDAVDVNRSLGDAPAEVISLARPVIEPINEGRLVHVSGPVTTRLAPQDTDLDIVFDGALAVRRIVEVYQWTETRNGPSFRYVQAWAPDSAGSARFRVPRGHVNAAPQITSQMLTAGDASLGDFSLSPETLAALETPAPVAPPSTPTGWIREGNTLFLGLNPARPRLGDIRVSYRTLSTTSPVSIIARQAPAALTPYALRNGTEILMIRAGMQTADEMLMGVQTLRLPTWWVVRLTAFFVVTLGLFCALLQAGSLPGHRSLLAATSPRAALQVSSAASAGLCATCMALAWILRLPFESAGTLLVCSTMLIVTIRFRHLLVATGTQEPRLLHT